MNPVYQWPPEHWEDFCTYYCLLSPANEQVSLDSVAELIQHLESVTGST